MKEKYIGYVIKLFKIITSQHRTDIQIVLDIMNIWFDIVNTESKDTINRISINYGNIKCKTIGGFRKVLHSKLKDDICELSTFCEHEGNRFIYLNTINNEVVKKEYGIEEFYLSFNDKSLMEPERFRLFIIKVYSILQLDYAYSFLLEKNIDIVSEKKIRNFWFSKSVSIEVKDIARENEILKITDGYIPQIYKYNVFNMSQVSKLKNIHENYIIIPINEQLVLYVER